MNMFSKVAAALALTATPAMASAQSMNQCMTSTEGQAVVGNLMPSLMTAIGERCAKFDRGSYIVRNSAQLSRGFQAHANASWPAARAALNRVGDDPLPDNELLLSAGRTLIAASVAAEMQASECDTISRLTEQLAPLPRANFANVVALFVEAGAKREKNSQLKFCD